MVRVKIGQGETRYHNHCLNFLSYLKRDIIGVGGLKSATSTFKCWDSVNWQILKVQTETLYREDSTHSQNIGFAYVILHLRIKKCSQGTLAAYMHTKSPSCMDTLPDSAFSVTLRCGTCIRLPHCVWKQGRWFPVFLNMSLMFLYLNASISHIY